MNQSSEMNPGNDPEIREFLEAVMRYQDGTLDAEGIERLAEQLRHDPRKQALFRGVQRRTAAIHDILRIDAFSRSGQLMNEKSSGIDPVDDSNRDTSGRRSSRTSRNVARWAGGIALGLAVAAGIWTFRQPDVIPTAGITTPSAVPNSSVFVEEVRQAKFSISGPMAMGMAVPLQKDYFLKSGMVKLKFPNGATTILEGPSLFNVANEERLLLKSGGCSVHAPPGAEGFEVLTPLTKVVDRGTRFYVNVRDNNETEVHVVEGAADLYSVGDFTEEASDAMASPPHPTEAPDVRLGFGEAVRIGGLGPTPQERTPFKSEHFRGQLPDRLMSYQASSAPNGSADELISLTVQRDGQHYTYSYEDLTLIDVTSFRADPGVEPNGYLSGYFDVPPFPGDALNDRKLVTGLINFGGQSDPLTNRPLPPVEYSDISSRPPGLGIRFRKPVINHSGPDVVLFEIQSPLNMTDGDPFHVYPISDRDDLKPIKVTKFDLTIESGGTRNVSPVWSHRYGFEATSIEDIRGVNAKIRVDVGHLFFHIIAVGIDLSDLGYANGEQVEELFLQHASPFDGPKLDPTMIVGLPAIPESSPLP